MTIVTSLILTSQLYAGGIQTLEEVEVTTTSENLIGSADTAAEGTITNDQIESRPAYRIGELLEIVPGLNATQHSGEGKANQYYLRGFNLDHGTDLEITIDDMPVNQRTHAHGQGYSDLNFLIPELVKEIQYKKGPYYAGEGDFSSVGTIHINYIDTLPQGSIKSSTGLDGYYREFAADSLKLGNGTFLGALEYEHNDGPWVRPADFRKINGVMRYSLGDEKDSFNVTVMGYDGHDNPTNQIPLRAVNEGLISQFGIIDSSDAISASRYSLSGAWNHNSDNSIAKANIYVINNNLDMFSNFTYFLNNPAHGDQFEQTDHRVTSGINASYTLISKHDMENTFGVQLQNDNIFVGLNNTEKRQLLSVVRYDHVIESSGSIYLENHVTWIDKFRTVTGLRGDLYNFQVNSDNPANSGTKLEGLISPKLSLIFGPWSEIEFYVSAGEGFHSNDARGVTISQVPGTGADSNIPASKVQPLVRSVGYEAGIRTVLLTGLQSSLSFFRIDFDSELTFEGDAGTTSPGRPSRRYGFEFTNYYKAASWLTIDADLAYAQAQYTASDPDPSVIGSHIPGSIEGDGSLGVSIDNLGKYFGGLRLRYLGPYPLIEDNSIRAPGTIILNARAGYKFTKKLVTIIEAFNLLNAKGYDIAYYYPSRLKGESYETSDIHFHPIIPINLRISVNYKF
ncbi:MAG: TonB-dependent receptor [Nitrospirae bacterium]|nr:TonB-dependent receptor [Nitrospirota bacterium]